MNTRNAFPESITLHKVTTKQGLQISLLVDPYETFGHALVRAGMPDEAIKTTEVVGAPIWYEPDYEVATR